MANNNSTDYKYSLAYCLEPLPEGGLTKAEMEAHPKYGPGGWGGCDKFVLASVLEMEDGSSSTMIVSGDPDGESLPAAEIYKIVILLCRKLAMDGKLSNPREAMCWAFFNASLELMGHKPQDLATTRKLFADD